MRLTPTKRGHEATPGSLEVRYTVWKERVMDLAYRNYRIIGVPKLTLEAMYERGCCEEDTAKLLGEWRDRPGSGIEIAHD